MSAETIKVVCDIDLEDLIPGFIDNRHQDVARIAELLDSGDLDSIRVIGHSMKGSGGGYGFDAITEIGSDIEEAAKAEDRDAIAAARARLQDYLDRVEIEYAEL